MNHRVVITGLGVVSPNGIGIPAFKRAIQEGKSGIRFIQQLKKLNFNCQVGGIPEISDNLISKYMTPLELHKFNSKGILYGIIAGLEAWEDAKLPQGDKRDPDWDSGAIIGVGFAAIDKIREGLYQIDQLKTKRLGGNYVVQTMPSGINAYLGGKLGLGNQLSTNSSACATGTSSILMAYERIKSGRAKRMLAGGVNDGGPYTWAGFDAMRVTTYKHNHEPEKASRPMARDASGFAPSSGAGILVLESLESALQRGVNIYGEILGGATNSGGQRNGGSMTLANNIGVQRCIRGALEDAEIQAEDIDLINGHLTSTGKCAMEIRNWSEALNREGRNFPYVTALKSMIGHCLSAAGAIESIAAMLQLKEGFLIPNLNCENLDTDIEDIVDSSKIHTTYKKSKIEVIAKAGFGFGDVNTCIIFKKYV